MKLSVRFITSITFIFLLTLIVSLIIVLHSGHFSIQKVAYPEAIGFSRENPATIGTKILFKDDHIEGSKLSIECVEMFVGEDAYNKMLISSRDSFINPLDSDHEYLIFKFNISYVHTNDTNKNFFASSGYFRYYLPSGSSGKSELLKSSMMEPVIEKKMSVNDTVVGWITFKIPRTLDDYVLVSFVNDKIWFKINLK